NGDELDSLKATLQVAANGRPSAGHFPSRGNSSVKRAIANSEALSSAAPITTVAVAGQPTTLAEVFERVAIQHKRKDTLNYKYQGRWVSASSDELMLRAKRIAAGLYSIGARRGDHVAILSDSRVEWT